MIAGLLAAVIAAAPGAAAAPVAGEIRTFQDWAVGCDNGRACQAVSQLPDGSAQPGTIAIARGAAADAPVAIRMRAYEGERPPAALAIDGKRAAPLREIGDGVFAPAAGDAAAVVRALRDARSATLVDAAGQVQGRAPLAGLAAALRYMDERQGRAGTVTALVATGAAPAGRVTPAPMLPVVAARTAVDDAPAAPAALVKRLMAGARCTDEPPDSETHRLDERHALILVTCWSGAYNTDAVAFVADYPTLANPLPARFDAAVSTGPDTRPGGVFGGYWDGDAGRLKTIAKARGLGDCGTATDWAWDGSRFRLIELRQMPACRGAIDWIPVWRAAIERDAGAR